jgi:molybdopterin molybdotransferase
MLSFDEALVRVLTQIPTLGSERVALELACGRVLAEVVAAKSNLPPFESSAMDGYAVASERFTGDPPWELEVHGESRTGRPAPSFRPGTACRIFTGAEVPRGADSVVMQEDVALAGGIATFRERPKPGQHVRHAGEDLPQGATALEAGTRLGPYQLGLLAAADLEEVLVARRPRVGILCTGDELRRPGSAPRPASIPESNSVVLAALARSAGAVATLSDSAPDDAAATRDRLAVLLDTSDLVVTVGGVSVGDHDVVRPALEASGAELDFYKVAIKPGKPLTFGRRSDTIILGLPGNPVSAQVTFTLFGLPLLRKMQGDRRSFPAPRRFRLGGPIRQNPGRRGFYAATVVGDTATPLSRQSSGSTVSLAHAEALVVVPQESSGFAEGETADGFLLSDF